MSKKLKKAGAYLLSLAVALQSMFSWGGLAMAAYASSGDGLATTAANEWQIPADGLKFAGNTPAQKTTVSRDGLVRVQKNVVPTDKENEFLVYLSLDAVSKKVFTTDTVTKMLEVNGESIYQGGTGNGFPKTAVEGEVRTGNGTLNPTTQGKNKPIEMKDGEATFTLEIWYNKDGKDMLVANPKLQMVVPNSVLYIGIDNNQDGEFDQFIALENIQDNGGRITIGGKTPEMLSDGSYLVEVHLTDMAYNALFNSVVTSTAVEEALTIVGGDGTASITDPMGSYIVYDGMVSGDITGTAPAAATAAGTTVTWNLSAKENAEKTETVVTETSKSTTIDGAQVDTLIRTETFWYLNLAEIVYKVHLDVEKDGFVSGTKYPVNGTTTLNYTYAEGDEDPEAGRVNFPVPKVLGTLYEFSFVKVDENGSALPGATFVLKDASGSTIQPAVKDNNGLWKYDSLPCGTYTLSETAAPEGYVLPNPASWTLNIGYTDDAKDGKVEFHKHIVNDQDIYYVKNIDEVWNVVNLPKAKAEVKFSKTLTKDAGLTAPDITGKFTFTLEAVTAGAPLPTTVSKTNPDNGLGTAVSFGQIAFSEVGRYEYKITESGTVAGVSVVGSNTQNVTVNVELKEGKLVASVSPAVAAFTNNYAVAPTTVTIPVEKIMNLADASLTGPADWSYDITIADDATDNVVSPLPEVKTLTVTKANPRDTFAAITFTAPGVYKYTLTESGTVAGVTNDSAKSLTITVTEAPSHNGTLVTDFDGSAVSFANTYSAAAASYAIPIKKLMTKTGSVTGPASWSFDFTITAAAGAPMTGADGTAVTATKTLTNTADSASFDAISFTKPGTYTYTITESGTVGGVTNDTSKTVTVTVTDNGAGQLVATCAYTPANPLTFTNNYAAAPATVVIPVVKQLTVPRGLTGPADWRFTLAIADDASDNVASPLPETASVTVNKSNPQGAFSAITFTEPGTYVYTVSETGTVAGVTNDSAKTVTITVTDNGAGQLVAACAYGENSPLTFTNVYSAEAAQVRIPVSKELTVPSGLTGPADWSFEVSIASNGPLPEVTTGTVSKANPALTFGAISYTQPGTYTYTVSENGTVAGVTNDSAKTVTVTVTDNGEGQLVATCDFGGEATSVVFTNTYSATSVDVSIPVVKELTVPEGLEGPADWSFTISISSEDPLPKVTSGTVSKANPALTLGAITYTQPGTYTYTVSESGVIDGVTNDSSKTVTVTVTDNGEGALVAACRYDEKTPLKFTNVYGITPVSVSIPVTKSLTVPAGLTGPADWSFEVSISSDSDILPDVTTGSVSKDAPEFTFGEITFIQPGTYTYTITENGTIAGVTNDSEKTVTIAVTDPGNGQLACDFDGEAVEFTNVYSAEEVQVSIPVVKELDVPEELEGPEDWSFTVSITSEGPLPAVTSGSVSKDAPEFTFGAISFTQPGTYIYTVSESGAVAGVTNDSEKTVTVTVTDNGEGQLVAECSASENAPVVFTNTYSAEAAEAVITVDKIVEVPEGLEGPEDWTFTVAVADDDSDDVESPLPAATEGEVSKDAPEFSFGAITFTKPGTYKYLVCETGSVAGVTNDENAVKTVTVEVADDHEGGLVATVITEDGKPVTFVNTYGVAPEEFEITVDKDFEVTEGMNGPEKWSFTVELEAVAGAPLTDADGNEIETVKTVDQSNTTAVFGKVCVSMPGTYTYKITESGTVAGVTNDEEATKAVTVVVTDNQDGTLSVEVGDVIEFTNTYDAKPVGAVIPVVKTLEVPEGFEAPENWSFKIVIEAVAGAPMTGADGKAVATSKTVDKDHTEVSFGEICFTKPGIYEYKITEQGEVEGIINDEEGTKTAIVVVTDDGEGNLTAKVTGVEFVNTAVNLPQTGDDFNGTLWICLMAASMVCMIGLFIFRKKRS